MNHCPDVQSYANKLQIDTDLLLRNTALYINNKPSSQKEFLNMLLQKTGQPIQQCS